MAISVIDTAERLLPSRLWRRAEPFVVKLDRMLGASGERAVAQRMSLLAFGIRIASAAIAFLSQVVLARYLGAFQYGIYVFVWTTAIIVGTLACLGFDIAVIRFLPKYRAAGAHAEIRGLTVAARLTALIGAIFIGAVGITLLVFFGSAIRSYYVVPLYIGILILPMVALNDVLDGTSRANGWIVNALAPGFIVRPLLILLFVTLAMTLGTGLSATTALMCALAATYVTTVSQYLFVRHRLGHHFSGGTLSVDLWPWMKVSLPIFVVEGFNFLLTNSDVIVVGLFLPPDRVAIYFAAAKSMALVHFVHFAVKAGAGPRFSELIATGRRDDLASSVHETILWSFWPSLAVGGVVVALGPFLLSLFGHGFELGVGIMALLFVGIIAKASVGPGEVLLTMADQQKVCVLVYAGALTVNITLNVVLIPLYGIYGAAAATAIAMVVEAVLLFIVIRRTLGIATFAFAPARWRQGGSGEAGAG